MINYTWSIIKMDVISSLDGLNNVVKHIEWSLLAEKDIDGTNYSALYAGSADLTSPDQQNFTSYDQITFELALNWVQQYLGESLISDLKKDLENQIDNLLEQQNQIQLVNLPLPWEST